MAKGKVCLAYSGGLDTSCILQYLLVSRVLNPPTAKCTNAMVTGRRI